MIRELDSADLSAVADVHLRAFPRAAITLMGREAARRFYGSLITGPHEAVALGAFDGDALAGYCFAGVWQNAEAHYLRQNAPYLALRLVTHPRLLGHPFFRERFRTAIRVALPGWLARDPNTHADGGDRTRFGIQSIAVDPRFQRRGVGRELLVVCEETARRRGFTKIDLSVHTDNGAAIAFYERHGWIKVPNGESWSGHMFRILE